MPRYFHNIELNQNQLIEAVIQPLALDPTTPKTAQVWFHNTAGGDSQGRLKIKLGTRTMIIDDQYVTSVGAGTSLTNSGTALAPVLNVDAASGSQPGTMAAADYTLLHTATSAATASALAQRDASGNIAFNMVSITAAPVNPTDAVNLAFVQTIAAGFFPKADVLIATIAPLPSNVYDNGVSGVGATLTASANSAFPAVDDITLDTVHQRILVKDEGDKTHNGIYQLTTVGDISTKWVLTRTADFNTVIPNVPGEIKLGAYMFVAEGTKNARTQWFLTTATVITIGATDLVFGQSNAAQLYTGSNGVTVSGSAISVNLTGVSTLETVANALRIKSSANSGAPLLSQGSGNEAAYGPLNLAGGVNVVTGALPKLNGGFGQDVSTGLAQNLFAATPDGAAGAMSFRAIASGDLPLAGTAGTYTKVTTDAYGRVTGSTTLSATDIPVLDFVKITTGNVPTTQGGFGVNVASLATVPTPWRLAALACPVGNIDITAPGATVDGVAMANGKRVFLKAQNTGAENGLWIWHGATAPLTRPDDFAAGSTVLAYQYAGFTVLSGTVNGGSEWYLTTAGAITIDTTPIAFANVPLNLSGSQTGTLPVAAGGTGAVTAAAARANLGAAGEYPTTITGNDVATSFTVVHGLGSASAHAIVTDPLTDNEEIFPNVDYPDTNTTVIKFAQPPTAGTVYGVRVIG